MNRTATLINFGLRTAYGAFMVATPSRVGRPWLGETAQTVGGTVPLRGVGGREITLHAAGMAAIAAGAPSRPWLLASIGGDLTDIASTFVDRRRLPTGGLRACVLTGGASVLMTLALIVTADD
jgi:hypothetical protein